MYAITELPPLEAIRHTQEDTEMFLGRENRSEGKGALYVDERYD